MSCRQCDRCGARWINGVHFWATGKIGSDLDLAGLVCNRVNDPRYQNPLRGMPGGDTWERRAALVAPLVTPEALAQRLGQQQ